MNYGLLIDLRAIQGYLFSSNRLKDNIGASFLVSHFFDDLEANEKVVGGGNMLCLCNSEEEAKHIIQDLSRKAISICPGLSFSAVYTESRGKSPKELISELWDKLQQEKQARWQQTTLPSYGINAQCSSSIYAAEYVDAEDEGKLISSVVKAKRDASAKANQALAKQYQDVLADSFEFTDRFDSLGTSKGEESLLAIVHIDGDDMGTKFAKCDSLKAYKELSAKVDSIFGEAFRHLVKHTCTQILEGEWIHYQSRLKQTAGKMCLPLRHIFIGGDDLSFVCEARLGITLALEYIKKVKELSKGEFSCCAGIAIAKERYPFYQSQQMAQTLCRNAKNKKKKESSKEAYLDYQLLDSTTTDPLDKSRSQYELSDGRVLYMKPYSIQKMQDQIDNAKELSKMPRSKVKEMREILFGTKEEIQAFMMQIDSRQDLILPNKGFDDSTIEDKDNIYPDMIELMELIPTGGK